MFDEICGRTVYCTLFKITIDAIFIPRLFFIRYSNFCSFMVVLGLGSCIGFLGLGFSVDGVWGLWLGAFVGLLGLGLSS